MRSAGKPFGYYLTMDIRSELSHFNPSAPIESALTPPASWYDSKEFFDFEQTAVFGQNPLAAARADQLEALGSWASLEFGKESWLITRDSEGTLNGLSNSCRHHGSRLCEGAGKSSEFVCPYHGWTYRLDGTLSKAGGAGAIDGLGGPDCNLPTFPVAEWAQLILLHPSGGQPLDPSLLTLAPITEEFRWNEAKWVSRRRYPMNCDWKVFVDNYLDGGYHVSQVHPDLAAGLNLDEYKTTWDGRWVEQTCPQISPPPESSGRVSYLWLYPNLMVNFYWPWVDVNFVIPTGPGRCEVVFDWWIVPEKAKDSDFIDSALKASDQVQSEDEKVCSLVQRGMGSASYQQGRYSPIREGGMFHFHKLLMQNYQSCLGD